MIAGLVLAAAPVAAIVMRHDRDDRLYLDLAGPRLAIADMNLPGGAGTLVGDRWVLTAAHVSALMREGRPVRLGGRDYPVRRRIAFPGGDVGRDDLALVELEQAVSGLPPVALYEKRDEAGQIALFAGWGMSGTGLSGPVQGDRRLRGATNRIERVTETLLVFTFDAPPAGTEMEGISGPGDSGGPALVRVDGALCVAGVSSGQDSGAAGKEGVYGVTEYYTRVSSYLGWLRETMASEGSPESVKSAR